MGSVIQRAREVNNVDDMDLVQSAAGIWCPSVQGPGGLILRDFSKNSNDGTLTNLDQSDWQNRALNVDSAAGAAYVDVGTGLDSNGPLTISAWFKANSVASGTMQIVVNNDSSGNVQDYTFEINRTAGRLATVWGNVLILTGSTALSTGRWYHACVVRTGAPGAWTVTLYLDGKVDGTTTAATNPNAVNQPTRIGGRGGVAHQTFNGLLDDVRIYPHALKPQQIARLYSNGQGRGIGLRPSRYVYEPIRTLTYPELSHGRVAAYSAGEQGPGGLVLRDQVGANHGTLTNMDPATDWVNDSGTALDFDGSNDYVDVGNGASLDITGAVTVSAWVKLSGVPVGYSQILSKDATGSSNGYSFIVHSDRTVQFWIGDGDWAGVTDATTALQDGIWYHVVGIHDGTTIRVYVNGEKEGSGVAQGTPGSSGNPVYIGSNPDTGSRFFKGQLDCLDIYNRALTTNEIRLLATRRNIAYETDSLVSPYTTQWGSVAAAEAAAFQAAWGASATTIAGVASGQ
jgi:hypothetical protein